MICLCPNAHKYWEKAYFALKPIRISDDKKRLDVQLFWLSEQSYSSSVDLLRTPKIEEYANQGPKLAKLYNHETDTPIRSGDEISLKTDDPVLRPLPDFRLLEMQWFLHRIAAMSGAAEVPDDYFEDSDENVTTSLQDLVDLENSWDMVVEESPAAERFPS